MKIATLSTYPPQLPRHGGQHRLANIVDQLREAGHTVVSAGVMGGGHYPANDGFLPYPGSKVFKRFIDNDFLMEDWAIGQWAAKDDDAFAALSSRLPDDIEVIHVEQPWMFAFARRWADARAPRRVRVLYGSANVEHRLKQSNVEGFLGAEHARACAEHVLACEQQAIASADLICAVSVEDARWIEAQARVAVVLAPNGVARREVSLEDRIAAASAAQHRKFALYCASAHPPNVSGFFESFGRGVGCFPPEDRLVVAGSVGASLQGHAQFARTPGLARHTIVTGEVDEPLLSGLLSLAHAIVLPITLGGGTNLKTAEALWAGCHVIATPTAMRGFESFAQARGVRVEADAAGFRAALRDAMQQPPLALRADERRAREVVLWESSLRHWIEQIDALDEVRA